METGLYYNRFRYYDPDAGNYISQDPIGLLGGSRLYGYVVNPTGWIDVLGLMPFWKPLKPTGMGHHPIPRVQANAHNLPKLGTPYDTPSWYPNEVNNSDALHQNMHEALQKEGVPFREPFAGTQGEMLDRVRQGYQGMGEKGFMKIPDGLPNANNAIAKDVTIAEAVEKQLEWNRNHGLIAGSCPP